GPVVPLRLEQVVGPDRHALVEPSPLRLAQRRLEEVAVAVKAEDRQAPLARAAARRREMIEEQLLAQLGVHGLGERRALARTERAMVTEEARHDRVGRVVELDDELDELGARVEQGFGMHQSEGSSAAIAR